MVDQGPPETALSRWAIPLRIALSLFCAASAGILGLVQPVVWYLVGSALSPGVFGHEYQILLPAIIAVIGGIGGGVVGLIAGAIAPRRAGMAASFIGLGRIHIAAGLYFMASPSNSSFAFSAILVPAVFVDFVLAVAFRFIRLKRDRL